MAEAFQYCELWSGLEAAGGTRLGFFLPITPRRRLRLTADDAFTFAIPTSHRLIASFTRGKVIREVLSLDGATVREWPIERVTRGTVHEVLALVECIGVMQLLTNYPISTTDADGFVYQNTPAVQLTPSTILSNFVRSNTPSWLGTGTVTPTALAEVAFADDSARSGLRRMEETIPGYEASIRRNGSSQQLIDFTALGASAATLYLRPGKQVKSLRGEIVPGQVTRVGQVVGADGDDGPSGLAWAYWEVEATSGAGPYQVKLNAIHGGPGPIAFDDQLNHANLPGGANSLYLEKRDGSKIQITDSSASTQEVTVSSLTTISVGDWVRIVASSTGKHLTFLDAPVEMAAVGVVGGRFESAWDDAVCVVKNPLQEAWSGTRPDNWTGGIGTKSTTAGEWLTAGQALLVNTSIADGAQIAAPPTRSWYISSRRSTFSAVAWIRFRATLTFGSITLRVKVGSTVVGTLEYSTPANVWRQLKLEGLDLSAYIGTTQTLTVEIIRSGDSGGTVNLLIDSICLFPALSARGVTTGSNAARTWQGVNEFLDVKRGTQTSYRVTMAELARMGVAAQAEIALGGNAVVVDEDLGTISTRVHEIEDVPGDPSDLTAVLATLPPRLTRTPSRPAELVIPYFEPIHVRAADRDTRNAAIRIKATVTASDDTSVTVTLAVVDTLGGVPTVAYAAFGATYVSGSGSGPYVFNKPAFGGGVGRVVFTASIPGRNEVTDAIDVPEGAPTGPELQVTVDPGATSYDIHVDAATGAVLEYSIDNGSWTTLASSPLTVARNAAGGDDKNVTIRGTHHGMVATAPVNVPAQAPGGGTVPPFITSFRATAESTANNTITLDWDVENAPGGYTLDLVWNRERGADGGNEGTITSISTTAPYDFDTDTHDPNVDIVAKGTGGAVKATYAFELRMKDGGTVVAVATCIYAPYASISA